jgi:hypothetical protein
LSEKLHPGEDHVRKLLWPPKKLGINPKLGFKRIQGIARVKITKKDKPMSTKDKTFYGQQVPITLEGRKCYVIASVVKDGIKLYAFGSRRIISEIESKASNSNRFGVAAISTCIPGKTEMAVKFVTDKPTEVAYRLFAAPNFRQKESEKETLEIRKLCIQNCNREHKDRIRLSCKTESCIREWLPHRDECHKFCRTHTRID